MKDEKENLLGLLIEAGIGSRRRLAAAIMQGRVTVNGQVVSNLRFPVDGEKDHIKIDGQVVELKKTRLVYLMLNKPKGVLSTVKDERGRKSLGPVRL